MGAVTMRIDPPSAKQKEFLTDRHRHVGYGGARGGGKSWAVRTKAKLLAVKYQGIKILIVRRSYRELINNHVNFLIPELKGIASYNKTDHVFHFFNGSEITCGYCNNDTDTLQYQGAEYDVVFLDEATQLQQDWIKKINLTVRGANALPKRTYYTCNPGGVSHAYFKRLFIDKAYEDGEKPEDYSFTQALVTDNDALMAMQPEYMAELQSLPPKLREAWLYGRWDIFEGQFFEDFIINPPVTKAAELGLTQDELRAQHRWCHVIEPFDLNAGERRGWKIMRSYDFGYNRPFSLGYWAIDYDGVLYRIMEMYGWNGTPNEGVKWSPDEQFKRMAELERTHPWLKGRKIVDSVADPAIWDASHGESIAQTAARYGIYFSPGDNQRIPGWMQVHYRLQFDEEGYARMYIFNTCSTFIRTMPMMMYSDTHPEDLNTSLEDHCPDEVRYMCMSRPVKPIIPEKPRTVLTDPLNQFRR